jgi:TolB protein
MGLQIYRNFLMLSLLLSSLVYSIEGFSQDNAEILVNLKTQSSLRPVYLSWGFTKNTGIKEKDLEALKSALEFDLSHSGYVQFFKHSKELDQVVDSEGFEVVSDPDVWRKKGIEVVLKARIIDKQLSIKAFNVSKKRYKTIRKVFLSGEASSDRRKIHQVSDALLNSLFGAEGIASGHILYTVSKERATSPWSSEVWECDYDGYNAHQVTHEGNFCVTPTYLPPKPGYQTSGFFYVSYRQGQPKIYVASLQNGSGRRFSPLRGNQLMPCVSANRDKIAFIADSAGNPDVYLYQYNPSIGAIGKPKQVFSSNRGAQGTPVFSPDAKKLAFVSNKDGSPRIYIIDLLEEESVEKQRSVQEILITKKNRENTSPSWSPDGRKLAYSTKVGSVRQIWYYDFDREEEVSLTDGSWSKENPSWAPDSLHLVFNSGDEGSSELYLINLNQPRAIKITKGKGEKRFPNWEPRGK